MFVNIYHPYTKTISFEKTLREVIGEYIKSVFVIILLTFQLLYNPQMNQVISGDAEGILKVRYQL